MNLSADHRIVAYATDVPCPAPYRTWDALSALADPAFLWQGREEQDVWLALGAGSRFGQLTEARAALLAVDTASNHLPIPPRCFAALPFELGTAKGAVMLPEVVLRWRNGHATVIALTEAGELAGRVVAALGEAAMPARLPRMGDGGHSFSRAAWTRAVTRAREEIRTGRLRKVVLARDSFRIAATPISVSALLERLHQTGENSYLIAFGTPERSFVCASPERLLVLDGVQLKTESLAGTRPRGHNESEDLSLAAELLHSAKDRAEQEAVTSFLVEQLASLCEAPLKPEGTFVRKNAAVQHLYTPVHARLQSQVTLDDLIRRLHPTPAICGVPREGARALIRELEPQPRGFYAGALGWIGPDSAEFAVGIRAAVIEGTRATVFAGAGIVAASEAEAEWQETAWKMNPMLRALGCAP